MELLCIDKDFEKVLYHLVYARSKGSGITMLSIEHVKKNLGEKFAHLTDAEIEQIRDEMYNFWMLMLED